MSQLRKGFVCKDRRLKIKGETMEIFDEVKNTFFRRRDDWKLVIDPQLPSQGRCDNETKTVKLRWAPKKDDSSSLILIHELCHSLPGCKTGTHGKVWQGQILKKAKIAKKKGMPNLAQLLINEVEIYKKSISLGLEAAPHVYMWVEEIIMDRPNISYDDLVEELAFEIRVTREELEHGYKRLRTVFEKTKKSLRKMGRINLTKDNPRSDPHFLIGSPEVLSV